MGTPMNSTATYYAAGMKAGIAVQRHDMSLYNRLADWYRRASRLENDTDKVEAGTYWDQGYHAGRHS